MLRLMTEIDPGGFCVASQARTLWLGPLGRFAEGRTSSPRHRSGAPTISCDVPIRPTFRRSRTAGGATAPPRTNSGDHREEGFSDRAQTEIPGPGARKSPNLREQLKNMRRGRKKIFQAGHGRFKDSTGAAAGTGDPQRPTQKPWRQGSSRPDPPTNPWNAAKKRWLNRHLQHDPAASRERSLP
jgi:hypothetical protein